MRAMRAGKRQARTKSRRRVAAVLLAILVLVGVVTTGTPASAAPKPPGPPITVLKPACGGMTKLVNPNAPKVWPNLNGYWQCTLTEDFDSATLNREIWNVQTTALSGFGQGGECFVDSPNNLAIRDGALELTVRQEAAPFACRKPNNTTFTSQWTAASVLTYQKFTQTYGRFQIRAKMPATTAPGLQFAYWLWPQDATKYGPQWPMSGEIDVMEWYSQNATRGIPSVHYWHPTLNDPNITNHNCIVGDMSQWHTYTLEWSPQTIRILYDGNVCLVNNSWRPENGISQPAPFDHPFMVSLTQALGVKGGSNAVNSATPVRNTATIDYVYAWI